MADEVSQNEEISGEGKDGERKGVGSATHRRRAKVRRRGIGYLKARVGPECYNSTERPD